MGTFSSLCNSIVDFGTKNSNARKNKVYNPNGKILKITPHHMAGIMTAKACAEMHKRGNGSSANYYIGNNGDICGGVAEERRAWTSGSPANDYQAITIEVSNSTGAPKWEVSEKAFQSLVNLCADICLRNGIAELEFTGDKEGNLTMHRYFQATACPGNYLAGRFGELADRVNSLLGKKTEIKPEIKPVEDKKEPYIVRITASTLNVRKGAGTGYKITTQVHAKECYTIVETVGKWGKLKSGAGWICLDYARKI